MADLYRTRQRRNAVVLGLSMAATAIGLGWLVLILGSLLEIALDTDGMAARA